MIYDSEEFWEAFEERAAIMEFDAHMDREQAEKYAFADICQHLDHESREAT